SVDITMDIMEGDGLEVDETLIITLGAPQNAALGSPAEQTIVITESLDEPSVTFAKSSQSMVEGDQILNVDVRLSNAWSYPVTVPFTVAGSAQVGGTEDFSISSSPLVIPVGWTQGSITVLVHDDTIDESMEDIWITMGEIENASLGAVTAHQIQIVDNDSPPEVFFTTLNKTEEENTGTVSVTVSLSAESVNNVSIPLNLSGTAGQGSDYSISTTNLVIPAGSQSGSFQITVVDDEQYELNEKVVVDLGFPTNGVLGTPTSFTLVIEDNELPPCDVGSHLLTVGADSISLSMVNEGEEVVLTGGNVTWTEASPNLPRLTSISFSGSVIYTGTNKPPSMSYTAWESFTSLATESVTFQFDGNLGTGEHVLKSNFQNLASGTTCSLTETFTQH
ncbi:MAG: hypothetical protein MUP11_01365, partial [Anaerolineales bacterium]|nr:hypothetical protein [Anaerolineales bacterium]